jgi:hypothetical protein
MDKQQILKQHANTLGAVPIYMYKDGRDSFRWLDLNTGFPIEFLKPFTKEWYRERMKMREELRKMKKKNLTEYNKYVIKNWDKVHLYIC